MECKWCDETVETDETGDIFRKEGSGKSVRIEENIELVEIILGQENQLGTHSTPVEIARELNIGCQPVPLTMDQDLDLRPLKKRKVQNLTDSNIEKSMIRSRILLSKYIQKTLQTPFFSKKIFKVKQLYNSHKDVVYIPKKLGK